MAFIFKKKRKIKELSLDEYYHKRNRILIIREAGGLGDILMHRMMFEDMKKLLGDCELHFACARIYHDALIDHPYIDKILDSREIDFNDYVISYNTTMPCLRYELGKAPYSGKHRSDIWAEHCGAQLTNHDMHIQLTEEEKTRGYTILAPYKEKGPVVLVCPISTMNGKNLSTEQTYNLLHSIKRIGYNPVLLHNAEIYDMSWPLIKNLGIREWMGVMNAADYVVSVDTAHFHLAGGLKKPVVGIFSFIDGKVYGRYYPTAITVQKHRDDGWTCGPCYNWVMCSKCSTEERKPCITELTHDEMFGACLKMFGR